jgi:hypothetical protein
MTAAIASAKIAAVEPRGQGRKEAGKGQPQFDLAMKMARQPEHSRAPARMSQDVAASAGAPLRSAEPKAEKTLVHETPNLAEILQNTLRPEPARADADATEPRDDRASDDTGADDAAGDSAGWTAQARFDAAIWKALGPDARGNVSVDSASTDALASAPNAGSSVDADRSTTVAATLPEPVPLHAQSELSQSLNANLEAQQYDFESPAGPDAGEVTAETDSTANPRQERPTARVSNTDAEDRTALSRESSQAPVDARSTAGSRPAPTYGPSLLEATGGHPEPSPSPNGTRAEANASAALQASPAAPAAVRSSPVPAAVRSSPALAEVQASPAPAAVQSSPAPRSASLLNARPEPARQVNAVDAAPRATAATGSSASASSAIPVMGDTPIASPPSDAVEPTTLVKPFAAPVAEPASARAVAAPTVAAVAEPLRSPPIGLANMPRVATTSPASGAEPRGPNQTVPRVAEPAQATAAASVRQAQADGSVAIVSAPAPQQRVTMPAQRDSRVSEVKDNRVEPRSGQAMPAVHASTKQTIEATGIGGDVQDGGDDQVQPRAVAPDARDVASSTADRQDPDAAKPQVVAPATVAAQPVQVQTATPAASVIATLSADPAWSAYFRETQPGSPPAVKALKIQLNPSELGVVTAHLLAGDDGLSVELIAETADAQNKLSADTDMIARSLRAIGVDIDRVTVQLSIRNDAPVQADSGQPRGFSPEPGAGGARGDGSGDRGGQQGGQSPSMRSGPAGGLAPQEASSGRYI